MSDDGELLWTATNHERCYALRTDWFIKRLLHEHELPVDDTGRPLRPLWDEERMRNEYAATKFIGKYTDLPVQECEFYMSKGVWHFASEAILDAIQLEYAPTDIRAAAIASVNEQIEGVILPRLREFTRQHIGSISKSVPVFPPARIYGSDSRTWERITSDRKEFVFCHNNLTAKNIWICPETLKIKSITGWEHAGFFPPEYELPLWTVSGWTARRAMQNRALERDLALFNLSKSDLNG
ncbi:hypothetical protein NLG97_g5846 [Lecanicillium saksenae]|uniref:Uncharacterized protein n=1 Tax=Lecanicillium saksenae TaxID=468837 RepID=A0ACC1QTP9_9HYPO|nr:hypothetical protein NLG97_g5846 [Lecanicillium saksenae]